SSGSSQGDARDGRQPLGRDLPVRAAVERSEHASVLGAAYDESAGGGQAARVDVVAEPARQAVFAALERRVAVEPGAIDRGAAAARSRRGRDQYCVVAHCHRAQVVRVHAGGDESPGIATVPAHAEAIGRGDQNDLGAAGVGEDLVYVDLDVDRRRPGPTAVARARDAADVDVDV